MHFDDDTERDMIEAIARLRKAEIVIRDAEAYIQRKMGDASEIRVGSHRVSWWPMRGKVTVDWRTIAIKLGFTDQMKHEHTTVGKPYRHFEIH